MKVKCISAVVTVMAVAACNTVDPDSCRPNASGGLGGDDGPIPIGQGVGATSGGDEAAPGDGNGASPCTAPVKANKRKTPAEYACTVRWWASSWMCQGEGLARLPKVADGSGDCYTVRPLPGRCVTASVLEKREFKAEDAAHSSPHKVTCVPTKWEQVPDGACDSTESTSSTGGSTDPNS